MGWKEKPQRKFKVVQTKLKLHKLCISPFCVLWQALLCRPGLPPAPSARFCAHVESAWQSWAPGLLERPWWRTGVPCWFWGGMSSEELSKTNHPGPLWLVDIAACGWRKRRPGGEHRKDTDCARPDLSDRQDLDAQEVWMVFAVREHALTPSRDPSPHAVWYINCAFPNLCC